VTDRQPFKVLLSFWYYRTRDLDAFLGGLPARPQVFVDSGAYSAGTQGAHIELVDYVAFLKRWEHWIDVFANLDQVSYLGRHPTDDAVATLTNQRRMEDMLGKRPIPVFHAGEDFDYLDGYCADHDYVALGGMASNAPAGSVVRWVIKCFRTAERTGTRFHGFGQTRKPLLTAAPWYSVDSSSWGSGHRYGGVVLWDGRRHEFVQVRVGDHRSVYRHARLIREHGVDPQALADRALYHRFHAISCSSAAWRKFEVWLRRLHGPIALPGRPDGLHLYLADTDHSNLTAAARAAARSAA
jgi:hypothetical protein